MALLPLNNVTHTNYSLGILWLLNIIKEIIYIKLTRLWILLTVVILEDKTDMVFLWLLKTIKGKKICIMSDVASQILWWQVFWIQVLTTCF